MDKVKNNLLEERDATAIVVGFIIGTAILALPNAVVQDAKQDGWIAVLVGALHPLYIALVAIYYAKKHPNQDILVLSNIYLGRILGTICNILFMLEFGIFTIEGIVSISNIYRVYATPFLTPIKIFIPTILIAIYLSDKGIKVLGRINKISLYILIVLTFMSLTAVRSGNYLNLFPIFGTGIKNILSGSIESALAYGGMEAIFLIYPFIKEKDKVKKITLKALFITIVIYVWVTVACIYTLGYKVTSLALWPTLLVTEGVNIPIINSFRFVFLFLWSIGLFRIIANEYYAFSYSLSYILKIKDKKKTYWIIFPIFLYLCLTIKSEVQRRAILGYLVPKITLFIIAYISIIAILIFIKDKGRK